MPISLIIDSTLDCTVARAEGLVTYDDLVSHGEEKRARALSMDELLDARDATTNLTSQQVKMLAHRTEMLLRDGRFGVLAVVATSRVAFGMARMYQILCDQLPTRIEVFRTIHEARAWLNEVKSSRGSPSFPSRR